MSLINNKIKTQIKSRPVLYNTLLRIRSHVPNWLIYSREYFKVIQLLTLNEDIKNRAMVNKHLAERLTFVLKEALQFVPYYRETIKTNPDEITPNNAHSFLQTLPFLSKKTVMDNKEAFFNKKYNKDILSYSTSGGSTGQGIGIWNSKREMDIEKAFFDYEWGKLGCKVATSKIVRFGTEARKKENEEPCEIIGNRLLISPYHLNSKWINDIYNKIIDFEPDFFHAYPSCVEVIAKHILNHNKPIFKCKGLLLASEAFTKFQYELFKKSFDAKISANYGLTERTNIAFTKLNDQKTDFYYKLIDIYSYSENEIDDYGNYEIVGTSYWNTVMPLLRYRTQDFGKIENGLIRSLDGRNQEFLITKTHNRIPGFSIKIDEFTWDYVSIYQILQNEPGKIILKIIPKPNFNNEIKAMLLAKQRVRWGDFFDITIELADRIPRTEAGKFRLIINNIKS